MTRSLESRYDAIVVGGGLAGLAAANRAAELKLRVLLLEAGSGDRYLCNSRYAIGFFHVAFHPVTANASELREGIEAATDGTADARLTSAVATTIGRGTAWLSERGVRFIRGGAADWMNRVLVPPGARRPGLHWQGRGGDVLLRTLAGHLKHLGGEMVTDARARRLRMESGRCVGLDVNVAGRDVHLATGAVILADGGFQGNAELVRRYISPKPEKLCVRNAGTGRGDGLVMAEEVGAKLVGLDRFYGHVQCREAVESQELWPYPILDLLTSAGIVVDRFGRRFADEGLGGIFMANAIAALDEPDTATVVFDDAIWNGAGREYILPPNPNAVEAGGQLISRPDLGSLAEALGIPGAALQETIDGHNAFLRDATCRIWPERTRRFGPPQPIAKAPFHAFRVCAGITYTMGGIAIDGEARVLDHADRPIPGLYAAGSSTGGLEGGGPAGYTGGLSKALVFGLLAGEAAARERASMAA
jgi:fumarate reductase flavoprotein subunit